MKTFENDNQIHSQPVVWETLICVGSAVRFAGVATCMHLMHAACRHFHSIQFAAWTKIQKRYSVDTFDFDKIIFKKKGF